MWIFVWCRLYLHQGVWKKYTKFYVFYEICWCGQSWETVWSSVVNISTSVSAGVSYDDPNGLELAKEIASKECLTFKGLYIHEGNAYNCAGEGKIKETTSEALTKLQIILNR